MYTLAIGDRTYSSWSLRGWLLFDKFNIPVDVKTGRMYTDAFPKLLSDFKPARTVPAMLIDGSADAIWDSLAIAETLYERHPDAGLWPVDANARAFGRSIAAEMHAGFASLRDACTMNLEYAYSDFLASEEVKADVARIEHLWALSFERFGGPWLLGEFSVADIFYAPVATRIATYGLEVSEGAQTYVERHLSDLSFRRWRAMARAEDYQQASYQLPFTQTAWPGPDPLPAKAVEGIEAINARCPYSTKPVQPDSLADIDGSVVGFCNPFCRDKSVADPEAWPALMTMLTRQ